MPPIQVVPSARYVGSGRLSDNLDRFARILDERGQIQAERQDSIALFESIQAGSEVEALTESQNAAALQDWQTRTDAGQVVPPPVRKQFDKRAFILERMAGHYGEQEQLAQKNAGVLGFLGALFGRPVRPITNTQRMIQGLAATDAFAQAKEQTLAALRLEALQLSGGLDRFRTGQETPRDRALAGIAQLGGGQDQEKLNEQKRQAIIKLENDIVASIDEDTGDIPPGIKRRQLEREASRLGRNLVTKSATDEFNDTTRTVDLVDPSFVGPPEPPPGAVTPPAATVPEKGPGIGSRLMQHGDEVGRTIQAIGKGIKGLVKPPSGTFGGVGRGQRGTPDFGVGTGPPKATPPPAAESTIEFENANVRGQADEKAKARMQAKWNSLSAEVKQKIKIALSNDWSWSAIEASLAE